MLTVEDCMQKAWRALIRGDTAERDRYCDLARNLMAAQRRLAEQGAVFEGEAIILPDRSHERVP